MNTYSIHSVKMKAENKKMLPLQTKTISEISGKEGYVEHDLSVLRRTNPADILCLIF